MDAESISASVPVTRRPGRPRRALVAGLVFLVALVVAGCSGEDGGPGPDIDAARSAGIPAPTAVPSSEPGPSPLAVPAGIVLTGQGTQLALGDTATVAYQPKQGVVGVLDIRIDRLERTTFGRSFIGWQLDDAQKTTKPYFVRATITNRGETDLADRRPPLYIVDGANTLVEATSFASAFPPCEPGVFAPVFGVGAKIKVCLVYLAPNDGDLVSVSFRPTQETDPITWTGEIKRARDPQRKRRLAQ